MKINWKVLIIAILICQLAGIIGSFFTFDSVSSWYPTLVKPDFTPPSWLFGPVWISLYTLMGISLYLVYTLKNKDKESALLVFFGQLVLNAMWSIIFFGLHSIFYGLIVIFLLWLLILLTIYKFYKINKTSAYLLIPYILWVSFAMILNYFLFILN